MNSVKQCGECVACCAGTLSAKVHKHYIGPGLSCFYLNKLEVNGCSIYDWRPEVCSKYRCKWLVDLDWPKELRPDVCGVIVDEQGSEREPGKPPVPRYRLTYQRSKVQQDILEKIKELLGHCILIENIIQERAI